jgi:hypothetical protein
MTTLTEELRELRLRKERAEASGRLKKEDDAAFREQQARCLDLMEAQECESYRTGGTLFSAVQDRVKGQVDDRRKFIRWALENDEAVAEFIAEWGICAADGTPDAAFEEAFYDAITNTSVVKLKEDGSAVNSMAKAHIDDEAPLPPGVSFRPDPYIGQRAS